KSRGARRTGGHLCWKRNLYSAARALGCEYEIDLAAELVRDELAYQVCAVARLGRSQDRWTAKLAPFDRQTCGGLARGIASGIAMGIAVPVHRHPTVGVRQRTMFCSVGHQLVKDHRECLGRLGGQHDIWAADRCVRICRVGCKLLPDQRLWLSTECATAMAWMRPLSLRTKSSIELLLLRVLMVTTATRASTFLTR